MTKPKEIEIGREQRRCGYTHPLLKQFLSAIVKCVKHIFINFIVVSINFVCLQVGVSLHMLVFVLSYFPPYTPLIKTKIISLMLKTP